jgi:ATP-dependent RNA helicase DeaD
MTQFKDYPLRPELQKALEKLGITAPTPIQEKTLAHLLTSDHVDFHGQAQTGTGKTLAFGLPLLDKLDINLAQTQALIVAPTRELVVQISEALSAAGSFLPFSIVPIYGGMSMPNQMKALKRGAHIVIGTPGRLNDHLRRKTLSLKNVHTIVLDEADIMLDMGFKEEVDEILTYAPENRRIWLFSATIKDGIEQIKRTHMKNVVIAKVTSKMVTVDATKQFYCAAPRKNRVVAIARFIDQAPDFYGFIFCPTKLLASEVADALSGLGYPASALHGDMNQTLRNAVIKKFKQRAFSILVATDVAARGIDVTGLSHVINYSMPEDHENYVHRIGRTGRAGLAGIAITLVNRNEVGHLSRLAKRLGAVINPLNVPRAEDIAQQRMVQAIAYVTEKSEQTANQSQYIAQLRTALQETSAEALLNSVASLLTDKFFAGLDKENDYLEQDTPSFEASNRESDGLQEVMLNVGTDDGVTEDDIKNAVLACNGVEEEHIMKMRVIKRRSFFTFPDEQAAIVIRELRGVKIGGMTLRPMRVYDERDGSSRDGGSFRRRSNGGGGDRRRSGGFGGRDRSDRGGFGGSDRGDRGGFGGRERSFGGRERSEGGFAGRERTEGFAGRERSEGGRGGERRDRGSFGGDRPERSGGFGRRS